MIERRDDPEVETLPEHSDLVFGPPERLVTGATWSEGPVWIPALGRLRFSDIPGDRILEWEEGMSEPAVYATGVEFTNGRILDRDGSVIQCSHGRRRVERDRAGVVDVIADRYEGARLNSPNDVIVTRDGDVLFTDPDYGITVSVEGHSGVREYGNGACWVFRVGPGGVLTPIVTDMQQPNGLALSPDESILYIADTSAVARQDGRYQIRAYDWDGVAASNGRLFVAQDGASDGFRVDTAGNVWTSAADAVSVYSPDGALLLTVPVPEVVSNVAFGGADGTTLFLTASTSLYRIPTSARDATSVWR